MINIILIGIYLIVRTKIRNCVNILFWIFVYLTAFSLLIVPMVKFTAIEPLISIDLLVVLILVTEAVLDLNKTTIENKS